MLIISVYLLIIIVNGLVVFLKVFNVLERLSVFGK